MDTNIYLDVNRFAQRTAWAHAFMHVYALDAGAALLALLVLVAFWRARSGWLGDSNARRVAATLWAAIGTLLALALNQPLSHAVGRPRPYYALAHVEVLVPRTHDFSFPSDHATVAGAVIAGLWLSRDRLVASIATLLGLFLAFARVYVGAHYPGDVLAGLAFGAFVTGAGYPLAVPWIEALVEAMRRGPLGVLVGARRTARPDSPGPAAVPHALTATGAVRVIEAAEIAPRRTSTDEDPQRHEAPST